MPVLALWALGSDTLMPRVVSDTPALASLGIVSSEPPVATLRPVVVSACCWVCAEDGRTVPVLSSTVRTRSGAYRTATGTTCLNGSSSTGHEWGGKNT